MGVEYGRDVRGAQWGKELRQAALTAVVCLVVFALFSSSWKAGTPDLGLHWTIGEPQQQAQQPQQAQRAQQAQQAAAGGKPSGEVERLRGRYLDAVRDSILGVHLATPELQATSVHTINQVTQLPFNASKRARGNDSPAYGLSMIGQLRMNNLRTLLEDVLARGVPGSFVECGVWRGGASIFAKAILTAYGAQRDVHLVDSFQGLPRPTTGNDLDWWSKWTYMAVGQEEVQSAFERFELLDSRVHFHKGFFRYALPAWRSRDKSPIALLRMDGDMYESTTDELYNLWDFISPGGYVIIDDWGLPECQKAMNDFFTRNKLTIKVTKIDDYGAWLQKTEAGAPIDHAWYQQFNSSRSNDDLKKGE